MYVNNIVRMLFITDTFQPLLWLSSEQFTRLQGVETGC